MLIMECKTFDDLLAKYPVINEEDLLDIRKEKQDLGIKLMMLSWFMGFVITEIITMLVLIL